MHGTHTCSLRCFVSRLTEAVDREMAHFVLTEVLQDTMQCSFEEREDDDYASLLWTTLKGRVLTGTVAEGMR